MTDESSGDEEGRDEDARAGSGPPTEEDVEAAKEELAAVGTESEDEVAEDDGGDETAEDAADPDAASDDELHAEDLVETPEERAVSGGPTETEGVADEREHAAADADVDATDAGQESAAPEAGAASAGADAAAGGAVEPAPDDAPRLEEGAAADADAGEAASGAATPDDAGEGTTADDEAADDAADEPADDADHQPGVPEDVRKYDRFKKVDGAQYDRVNEFLRDRTYITAREWAIARLCSDFRTETGVEMTKIGENLPELVPFMTDTYTPQAVNQARASFEDKVRTAGATFLYGAMCDFFTAEELDDVMYEATEVAKFLLEVEGVELSVEEELEAEDRISAVMRDVRESSAELRHESCPECGAHLTGDD